jgi:Protein of unknown function (DUF3501)
MTAKREITTADILDPAEYARTRVARRRELAARKRLRRVEVGPTITFYFENYDTMWHQVHEMLHIERGGEEQVADELAAYNPLIPQGAELVATFMIEIDDELRRKRVLSGLGGIEDTAFFRIGDWTITATPESDTDRTTADGKASSVQFVHFPFTPSQITAFGTPGAQVVLGLAHKNYSHMAVLPEAVRAELAGDFA